MTRFAATVVLLAAAPAMADDSHYQDFVIGGRAIGLGGAFVSLADDSSGLYYNPAGLGDVHQTNVQLSTSLYGFERGSIDPQQLTLPVPGVENLNVQFTELIIIPATAGFVKTFGKPGPDGDPVQAYGVSIVVPSFRSASATNPANVQSADSECTVCERPPTYSRRASDRALWTGIGYGRKLGSNLRVGLSGYYILRSGVDTEEISTSADIRDGDANAANDQQLFRSARNDISYINGNVVLIAGAKYTARPGLTVAASFQTPSVPVHSQSSLRFSTGVSVPSCEQSQLSPDGLRACEEGLAGLGETTGARSSFTSESIDGGSETRYPATVRAGANYTRRYKYTVAVDASYHFPVEYKLIRSRRLTAEVLERMPFNPNIERTAVLNVNAGAEFLIVREVSVSAGFFSDFSSAPKIPEHPERDYQPRVNMQGLTLALGYFGKHTLSRLGVLYSWGSGRDVIPTNDIARVFQEQNPNAQAFSRVDYFQSFFYVFLSSTFRY